MTRRNILVSGGTGSGKTTLLNALIELLPDDERIVSIEDTLELRIEHSNCVRFEARGLSTGGVTIRGPGASFLAAPPGSHRRGRGARRRSGGPAASPQHRTRRLTHHRTRQQRRIGLVTARQLRHAGRRRTSLGSYLPGSGGWHCNGDSHDAPGGTALRGGGLARQRLRRAAETAGSSSRSGGNTMRDEEKIIQVNTLKDFGAGTRP